MGRVATRPRRSARPAPSVRRTGSFPSSAATSASAVARASPITPMSTGRCAPMASASRSTWATRARCAIRVPWRVVHWFSAAPKATTTSASPSSCAATGDEKPPAMPTAYGSPANSPFATAEVASTAPVSSPSRRRAGPAPASTAPRPAMIAGRSACASSSARASTEPGRGGASAGSGGGSSGSHSAACTSSGSINTTARRSTVARRTARATSAIAVCGPCTRSATAPTDCTRPAWSIRKFERRAAAGVSAAITMTGVRLLAASVRPVTVLVSPGPWCTLQAASLPLTRP